MYLFWIQKRNLQHSRLFRTGDAAAVIERVVGGTRDCVRGRAARVGLVNVDGHAMLPVPVLHTVFAHVLRDVEVLAPVRLLARVVVQVRLHH